MKINAKFDKEKVQDIKVICSQRQSYLCIGISQQGLGDQTVMKWRGSILRRVFLLFPFNFYVNEEHFLSNQKLCENMSLAQWNVPSATMFNDNTQCSNEYHLIFDTTFSNNCFIESLIFPVKHRFKNEAKTSSCHQQGAGNSWPQLCKEKHFSNQHRVVKVLETSSIYSNKVLRLDMKEKQRERKKLTSVEMAKIREK